MVILNSNKSSFFYIEIEYSDLKLDGFSIKDKIEVQMDIVLQRIQASYDLYKFESDNKLIYMFSTQKRKRQGQLVKIVEKELYDTNLENYLKKPIAYSLLKREFLDALSKMESEDHIKIVERPKKFPNYDGKDIKVLNNKKNWHKWQIKIYKKFFKIDGTIKDAKPEDRKIIFIYDKTGFSGKSTFYKWLYVNNTEKISFLSIGTSSQLRKCLTQIPNRSIYLFDLPRSLEKTIQDKSRIPDLLSVVEELKSGLIFSTMYGMYDPIVQNKSHCLISTNFIINPGSLSKDRLIFLEITKDKDLIDITSQIDKKYSQQETLKKSQNPVF